MQTATLVRRDAPPIYLDVHRLLTVTNPKHPEGKQARYRLFIQTSSQYSGNRVKTGGKPGG